MGYKEVTGQTPNISEWLDFEFYDLVWWLDHPMKPDVKIMCIGLLGGLAYLITLDQTCVIGLLWTLAK